MMDAWWRMNVEVKSGSRLRSRASPAHTMSHDQQLPGLSRYPDTIRRTFDPSGNALHRTVFEPSSEIHLRLALNR
jgi:hypothetical protein